MENVLLAIFNVESEAYQAMAELKTLALTPETLISQAVLVKSENGLIKTKDSYDTGADTQDDTAKGGIIGSFIGILGGPLGVILGAGIGSLVGAAVDLTDADTNASIIEQITEKIPEGAAAVITLVQEHSPTYIDSLLAKFDVTTLRYDAAIVAEEIEEAEKVQEKLEKEARAAMRKARSDEFKSRVENRRNKIREHFSKLGKS